MKLGHSLPFIFCLFAATLADVEFTVPAVGTDFKAGDVVTAHWKDSGAFPRISDLTHYDLYLYAGGQTADTHMEVASLIQDGMFARGNSVSFKINPHFGGSQTNAYFLKMVSFGPEAFAINFSDRFTLKNMTGSFPPQLMEDIRSLSNSEDPTKEELRKRGIQAAYTVPYLSQTGPTRYAPMAKKPGSTIPAQAKTPTPQFTASLYTIATTWLPVATVHVTLSASMTSSIVSIENTASPAPHPHDVAARKLLERWKD